MLRMDVAVTPTVLNGGSKLARVGRNFAHRSALEVRLLTGPFPSW